jgi:sugar phosphate isomerase/epimerase
MALFDRTTREVAEFAAETGYDGVELICKEGRHLQDDMSLSEIREIRNVFTEFGVEIFSISGYSTFTSPDESIREKNLDALCRHVEFAHELGASFARCLGGRVPYVEWEKNSHDYIELLGMYLRKAAERTEGSGIDILLSTHDNFSPAQIASRVITVADHPRVLLLWCVIHPLQFGEDLATTWQYIRGHFRLVHFKDAIKGALYQWWPLRKLGAGELPLLVIARLLMQDNYEGSVSIEWEKHMHPEIEDSETVLKQGLIYLKEVFQLSTGEQGNVENRHW